MLRLLSLWQGMRCVGVRVLSVSMSVHRCVLFACGSSFESGPFAQPFGRLESPLAGSLASTHDGFQIVPSQARHAKQSLPQARLRNETGHIGAGMIHLLAVSLT